VLGCPSRTCVRLSLQILCDFLAVAHSLLYVRKVKIFKSIPERSSQTLEFKDVFVRGDDA